MSRLIITITIFAVIAYTMITGYNFISESKQEFIKLCDDVETFIENSEFEKADYTVSKIIKMLKKDRKTLMIITDHDLVESLNTKLDKVSSYIKTKEKSLASAELAEARNIMSIIHGSQELSIENIL